MIRKEENIILTTAIVTYLGHSTHKGKGCVYSVPQTWLTKLLNGCWLRSRSDWGAREGGEGWQEEWTWGAFKFSSSYLQQHPLMPMRIPTWKDVKLMYEYKWTTHLHLQWSLVGIDSVTLLA